MQMKFEVVLIVLYIIVGLGYANIKARTYAKDTKQRRSIMMAREGLKTKFDLVLFYFILVIFWPLIIRRNRKESW